jgi:hypothetical protein
MAPTHTAAAETDGEVMGAIDDESDGDRYVVADISRDDAWVSTLLLDAVVLEEWR